MQTVRPAPASHRHLSMVIFTVIIAAFAVRNLPWHLDDFDQAKQAFVSFEMVEKGQWWFQHTPAGRIATKPPLAGWISAALRYLVGESGWELAWRLPSFAAALTLLALLARGGRQLAGPRGALLATCAFGFNLLAPRLATLVRTDMLLTLFIFLAGWLICEKIRRAVPWTTRERLWLSLAVLGSMMIKGPILYAFILPGLATYSLLRWRRGEPNYAWAGWWPWFAPLLIFAIWVGVGVKMSHEFYRQVVLKEFLGRFDLSDAPVHKHQPFWFYFLHLLHKWGPWSVALIVLAGGRPIRAFWFHLVKLLRNRTPRDFSPAVPDSAPPTPSRFRTDPAPLWLACWAICGLVFMSLIPSKRVDRIFPIIPPLCLLLAALAEEWFCARTPRHARLIVALVWLAGLISTGYTIVCVASAFRADERGLGRFGAQVRALADGPPARFAVVDARDEGLLLYTGRTEFTSMDDASDAWQRGELDRMLLPEKDLREHQAELAPYTIRRRSPQIKDRHGPYLFIERGPSRGETPAAP